MRGVWVKPGHQLGRKPGQAGQTMVDLVVAITLLTLALLSAGTLATSAAKASVISGQRTQATALATRELEALRNYRDSLAKYNEPWSIIPSGNCNPGNGASFIIQADSSNPQIPWNLVTVSDGNPVAYSNNDDTGYGAYSMFSRLVTVCDSPTSTDAKSVQVKVVWPAGQVKFTTIITNWKTSS